LHHNETCVALFDVKNEKQATSTLFVSAASTFKGCSISDCIASSSHGLTWRDISCNARSFATNDRQRQVLTGLYRLDVFGARAFFALAFGKGHFLPFAQFLERDPLEARRMEKQVFPLACVDEPKALVRQLLDSAFRHFVRFP
jgi:hypothetical protein